MINEQSKSYITIFPLENEETFIRTCLGTGPARQTVELILDPTEIQHLGRKDNYWTVAIGKSSEKVVCLQKQTVFWILVCYIRGRCCHDCRGAHDGDRDHDRVHGHDCVRESVHDDDGDFRASSR